MSDAMWGRVRGMISRAIINLVNDASKAQSVQIDMLAGETMDAVERFQNYGFTSVPHPDAEAIAVAVGGTRSHVVIVAVEDRRYRLTGLPQGEVAIYDDQGQAVHLMRDGIELRSSHEVRVIAPVAIIEADEIGLGGEGGAKVARIGDDVDLGTGKIISGSDKVRAL